MKKLTKAQLKLVGVFNSHNLFAETGAKVFINYSPQITGRGYRSAKWQVVGKDILTDPKGHWMDNGAKSFHLWHKSDKDSQLVEAKIWASANYGISTWTRDVFGSWHDSDKLEKCLVRLAAECSSLPSEPAL